MNDNRGGGAVAWQASSTPPCWTWSASFLRGPLNA